VMQWTMPSSRADNAGTPRGFVVAVEGNTFLTVDGGIWLFRQDTQVWDRLYDGPPIPLNEVLYFSGIAITSTNGELWERSTGAWVNRGQPPMVPVGTSQSTWGKIKSKFSAKGDKP